MSNIEQVAEQLSESGFLQNLSPPIQMSLIARQLGVVAGGVGMPDMLHAHCDCAVVRTPRDVNAGNSTQLCADGAGFVPDFFHHGTDLESAQSSRSRPYLAGKISGLDALRLGTDVQKGFLLRQTRKQDLALFLHMSQAGPIQEPKDTPFAALVPAS